MLLMESKKIQNENIMYAKNSEVLNNKYSVIKNNYGKILEENENMKKQIYELENFIQSLRQQTDLQNQETD